jgi:hypothetical protein
MSTRQEAQAESQLRNYECSKGCTLIIVQFGVSNLYECTTIYIYIIYGHSLAGIMGSNTAESMDVCL